MPSSARAGSPHVRAALEVPVATARLLLRETPVRDRTRQLIRRLTLAPAARWRMLVVAAAVTALLTCAATAPGTAQAAQSDFCGRLVASNAQCAGFASASFGTWWTYTSNTYNGGGAISEMWAGMADLTYGSFSLWFHAFNFTFVNGCWKRVAGSTND